jgi:hypothetical protein
MIDRMRQSRSTFLAIQQIIRPYHDRQLVGGFKFPERAPLVEVRFAPSGRPAGWNCSFGVAKSRVSRLIVHSGSDDVQIGLVEARPRRAFWKYCCLSPLMFSLELRYEYDYGSAKKMRMPVSCAKLL